MAVIKSALELALERAKGLQVDESAQKISEARMLGRKAAARWMEDPSVANPVQDIQGLDEEARKAFARAAFDILTSQLQLPLGTTYDAKTVEAAGKTLTLLARVAPAARTPREAQLLERQLLSFSGQITDFIAQYMQEMQRIEQAIRNQWAPRLREKERQLAAQLGQNIRIDPMSDPEFAEYYRKNVDTVRKNYTAALEQAKAQVAAMLGLESE
ncbi:MAG: hypothetical protein QHH01_06345 [Spirochaetales bacterium]|nr:hypothetical protein [Spirochaetales bacterium]